MQRLIQKTGFYIKYKCLAVFFSVIRKFLLRLLGMKIGANTLIPKLYITWPHRVKLGNNCQLEENIYFKHDGVWGKGFSILIQDNVFIGSNCEFNITERIEIGKDSKIASGCRFIDHNHSTELLPKAKRKIDTSSKIILHEDVWLGVNVVVLMGVEIGKSAIVAAGAVVTKSIPENEIWAGVPARKIGERDLV
ncbi:acyltransferase [Maribacter dokdonensis]|uniref:acyltransferase n=1 Tax=Maribacter dokdonensis TaxID=320912 RepID=UPI0032899BCB